MVITIFTKLLLLSRYLCRRVFTPFYHLGWKVVFQNSVTIRGAHAISLGDRVSLDTGVLLQVVEYNRARQHPVIEVHSDVGIGPNTVILAKNNVTIESGVMIGPHCVIVDYDHQYSDIKTPIYLQPLNNNEPIIIKRGAWISSHCTICSGVTIGEHAVIGANSVVTKDVPAFSVVVGAPAKVIKLYNPKSKKWERV